MMNQPTREESRHPFEHLAPAPYSFVGVFDASRFQDAVLDSAHVAPLEDSCVGSCDHCGTPITVAVKFKGANGTEFKVGETCAEKALEPGTPALTKCKKACNDRRSKLRKDKLNNTFENAVEWAQQQTETPHPKGWVGKSLSDYLYWFHENAGQKTFIDTCKKHGFNK
jgi:hypothetical protein